MSMAARTTAMKPTPLPAAVPAVCTRLFSQRVPRTPAALVLQLHPRTKLALQLFHQVPHLRALLPLALRPGQSMALEPLHQRLDRADGKVLGDDLLGRLPQGGLLGNGEQRARVAH